MESLKEKCRLKTVKSKLKRIFAFVFKFMFKPKFKFRIGDRNGDFILKRLEFLGIVKGKLQFRETWLLDPLVILTPDAAVNEAFQLGQNNAVSAFTSPDNATTELNDTEYGYVQAEDGVTLGTAGAATIRWRYANAAQKYTFNTIGYDIIDITCIWKGYRDPTSDVPDLERLQVYKATAWEDWLTTLPITNTKYTKSLGNGSAYFYNTSWIRFGVYMYAQMTILGEPYSIMFRTDYAALQITYRIPIITVKKAGLNPARMLAILEEA